LLALEGLSVGDAFGEQFFGAQEIVIPRIAARRRPKSPWGYTDDTEMATALTEVLLEHGRVDQSALAQAFVRRYVADPNRGYGGGAHDVLQRVRDGDDWKDASAEAFHGKGSMGNGAAMRVGPLGAFFADDLDALVPEALASAAVTHAHPDGQAGAVAVAVAAAYAWLRKHHPSAVADTSLLDFVTPRCPEGPTRYGLREAQRTSFEATPEAAARALGNGWKVISSDTVPFALWCAQRHLDNFVDAMWATVAGLGDRDTTCAIAGGVVALHSPPPVSWIRAREPLRFERLPHPAISDVLAAATDAVRPRVLAGSGRKRQ
jgi:ADP-ribosylglycohydrolase